MPTGIAGKPDRCQKPVRVGDTFLVSILKGHYCKLKRQDQDHQKNFLKIVTDRRLTIAFQISPK
jgi:hypothetical protein